MKFRIFLQSHQIIWNISSWRGLLFDREITFWKNQEVFGSSIIGHILTALLIHTNIIGLCCSQFSRTMPSHSDFLWGIRNFALFKRKFIRHPIDIYKRSLLSSSMVSPIFHLIITIGFLVNLFKPCFESFFHNHFFLFFYIFLGLCLYDLFIKYSLFGLLIIQLFDELVPGGSLHQFPLVTFTCLLWFFKVLNGLNSFFSLRTMGWCLF